MIHLFNHALMKGALFMAMGSIFLRLGSVDIRDLQGLARDMPFTVAAFVVGGLCLVGVPLTVGFVSKWYILAGAFQADNYAALATIIVSTALNAAYFLPVVYRAFFCAPV